ncbi:MAG: HAMP domain-containing protein [Oceanicaulis sp.]|nr:HAMP domain-containing protein [Oceanicaulis sp.]
MRFSLKRYLPKGLFQRSLLIIVLPVALMQGAVTWAFFEQHWRTTTARLSENIAGDVALIVKMHQRSDGEDFDQTAALAFTTLGLSVEHRESDTLPTTRRTAFFRVLDRTLRRALAGKLSEPFWFDTTRYPNYVDIRVETEGGVLRFIAARDQVFATTGHIFVIWLSGATLLLLTVAILFIRNQVKPIRQLAEAAEAFGRGQDVERFKPAGAREVRQAASAFLDMRARLKRHMEQRTQLLAGVSHDLRTPLTRLRLQLALMPDSPERDAARSDIAEMEAALEEYLAFARGQAGEEPGPVDLTALCETLGDDAARQGVDLRLDLEEALTVQAREGALKRALVNLVQNAAAHGQDVALSARRQGPRIEVIIDDDGPGIDPELREDAFRPFNRLDDSRNANHTGVGLGLAIARDTVRAHGGELRLEDSPLGGLRARVSLPA